ncbi:MAG TPA: hypothetical protein VKV77_05930 [Methylovirgula sp.]|nr:hypothetical protein [Methylovirgula sp.]
MRPIAFALIAAAAFATSAEAAVKHHHHLRQQDPVVYDSGQPPLEVNKRSWLDPGNVVQPGTMESYVTESTGFNKTPDQAYQPSRFGGEALPRPLYPTGRPEPIVEFWTPGYPY